MADNNTRPPHVAAQESADAFNAAVKGAGKTAGNYVTNKVDNMFQNLDKSH